MKNKIVLSTVFGAFGLLVLVPSAMLAGKTPKPAGLQIGASCSDVVADTVGGDTCSVTITGLAAGKSYQLEVVNNCAGVPAFSTITADSSGGYNGTVIAPETGRDNCTTTNWTFYLLTTSGRQLASGTVLDSD